MRRYRREGFRPFSEFDGFVLIEQRKRSIIDEINRQSDDYILNVNKEEYLQHLESEFIIEPVEIHRDHLFASTHEEQIPAEMHPFDYLTDAGESYVRDVMKYHLPFTGDEQLLRVRGSTYSSSAPLVTIEDGCICFTIINFNLDAERIRRDAENNVNSLITLNGYLTRDLEQFNSSVRQIAEQALVQRRAQLLKKHDLMSSLGVPIRRSNSTPETFSIPAKRTKVIASKPKPEVKESGYKPEPTLNETIYFQILGIIQDVGKQFERLPSTYSGKDEEALRDHLLLMLEPNFEGSATGETFNKTGKTDILLRHEGNNVFVAELKFWRGPKAFSETIDQLLGYLTWRDSKAALVIFVKNKDFSSVLKSSREALGEHPNYLGYVNEQDEGWYNYRLHIVGDRNREVRVALMLFHLPE